MSFVSFLKTFGLDALKGAQIFLGVAPVASQVLANAGNAGAAVGIDKFDQMLATATSLEQSFAIAFGPDQKTGAAKFAALAGQMQQIVMQSAMLTGKEVADPALFTKAMQEYAQGTADLLNSLKGSAQVSDNIKNVPKLIPANIPIDVKPISVTTATKPATPAS